ncbi:HPr family phosphocarrier protein [Leptospira sp. GIMC2001]|uniref:HPr family phosphocarrier protein n=1 Tax=Leptospira sp. GIMC2001 TaxID=1513297 RepID=UPI00234B6468|nr:HPr family phosphocarrier protein [Leptospira sp. GIMC2001]WCL47912.1 HPr family phosphocarrier protein [Leptospira sp. GIMC2001]
MKQILLKILDTSNGLHARPASVFVRAASQFPCEISVIRDDVTVNGKSILGLMMLALGPGAEFTVIAEGEKEEEALEKLKDLVINNFQVN